jgi:hypothetical protein
MELILMHFWQYWKHCRPIKGYRRLVSMMMQPQETKYETKPLIGLADFAEVDSEAEWKLRKQIYL